MFSLCQPHKLLLCLLGQAVFSQLNALDKISPNIPDMQLRQREGFQTFRLLKEGCYVETGSGIKSGPCQAPDPLDC